MEDPDRRLVRDASGGDELALDALLERHLPGVLAFVRVRAGARILARESSLDLVQSACREVLADLSRYDYRDEAGFRHWLYLSAERKILERARRDGREKRGGGREALTISAAEEDLLRRSWTGAVSPSGAAIAREEIEQMELAMSRLSEEHREVILLARFVGLSHAEIGERLGKSERAVTSLLHRALAQLAIEMGPGGASA